MKANSFLNKLTENLPIKIICFVVAILLYLFYQLTLIEKQILVIPLSVEQSGGVVLKETVQSSVKVYVRTKNTTQVHSDEVKACLNIDYITETGEYEIPVTLSVSDELLSIDPLEIKVKPESVKVKVERKISSAAYVNVRTIGEVKHGYKICEMSVEPELVQFSGAESVVKSIKSFDTEVISLDDLSSDKEFLVRLQNPNRKVTVQNEPTYIVKVKVEPEISEKTVSYVKPVIQNLSENFEVNSSFETISFRLSGPVLSVEPLDSSNLICRLNLASITEPGEYEFPVILDLPYDVIIVEKSSDTWKFSVIEKIINEPDSELSELFDKGSENSEN